MRICVACFGCSFFRVGCFVLPQSTHTQFNVENQFVRVACTKPFATAAAAAAEKPHASALACAAFNLLNRAMPPSGVCLCGRRFWCHSCVRIHNTPVWSSINYAFAATARQRQTKRAAHSYTWRPGVPEPNKSAVALRDGTATAQHRRIISFI